MSNSTASTATARERYLDEVASMTASAVAYLERDAGPALPLDPQSRFFRDLEERYPHLYASR